MVTRFLLEVSNPKPNNIVKTPVRSVTFTRRQFAFLRDAFYLLSKELENIHGKVIKPNDLAVALTT